MEHKIKTEKTHWVKIYISGPIYVIEQTCRKYCMHCPVCVTVDNTKFIYPGGEQVGAVIGLINYPRFPASNDKIEDQALDLSIKLLKATHQDSALIMTPEWTQWIRREDRNA